MKKYSLKNLAIEITGQNEYYWDWDREYDLVRRIDKAVKSIFNIKSVTDENKDQYIRVCKLLYDNYDTRRLMNKYAKIVKRIREIEVIEGVLTLPEDFKSLESKDSIKIFEVLVEFYRGTEKGHFLEERMCLIISEEYNKVLSKFEEEIERIKMSLQGYSYREKIAKIKELHEYLNKQRLEIDKNINDNLILPE